MRAVHGVILAILMLSFGGVLAGCDTLENFEFFDTKKKLPGERKPVFPEGVPGVSQGIPAELVKGYQEPAQQPIDPAAAAAQAAAQEKAEKAEPKPAPKPKPRVAARPKPQQSQQPQQAQAPAQQQPQPQAPWPSQQPQPAWPQQQAQPQQPAWPTAR